MFNFMKVLPENQPIDPRPDIKHDHSLWVRILSGARKYSDLHARLHFVRCIGGYVKETQTMYQLLQGEMTTEEWEMVKQKVLAPISDMLVDYFKHCRNFTEVTDNQLIKEVATMFDIKEESLRQTKLSW
jgi:DNA-binding protein Fis